MHFCTIFFSIVKALRVSERDWKHSVVRALIVSLLGKQTGLKGVMEKGVTQASLIDHEESFFCVHYESINQGSTKLSR
jgi:hypothetical protein